MSVFGSAEMSVFGLQGVMTTEDADLGLEGHRLHDARHHWRVRMARIATFELRALQLGRSDVAMVAKVYGRFKPDPEKRDRWERAAARAMRRNGRLEVPRELARQR